MSQPVAQAESVSVWKVGGSLLTLPDLPQRLQDAMKATGPARPLIVVGGGQTADLVRRWDRVHGLGDERAHWLALESLGLNERLLSEVMPKTCLVKTRPEAERVWAAGLRPILHAVAFVRAEETSPAIPLPHCWDVTSDSVAAWIAALWPADELVLVKSTAWPDGISVQDGADRGLVDPWFPRIASREVRLHWINLRNDPTHLVTLEPSAV